MHHGTRWPVHLMLQLRFDITEELVEVQYAFATTYRPWVDLQVPLPDLPQFFSPRFLTKRAPLTRADSMFAYDKLGHARVISGVTRL